MLHRWHSDKTTSFCYIYYAYKQLNQIKIYTPTNNFTFTELFVKTKRHKITNLCRNLLVMLSRCVMSMLTYCQIYNDCVFYAVLSNFEAYNGGEFK